MVKEEFSFFGSHPELYEEGFDYREMDQQVHFLDKLFSDNKCKKILDVACGHSPHGRMLAKKGYKVSGIDLSEPLLRLGRLRASQERVNIRFCQRDMSDFFIGKFDAAYILFSSILHLYKGRDLNSHFRSVGKSLKRGGLYIIDISSLPFKSPFVPNKITYSKGRLRTIIEYTPVDASHLVASFKMSSILKGKIVNRDDFSVLMFLPLPFLVSLSRSNGFDLEGLYSDFDFSKDFDKKKPEYIAVLRKK